MFGATDKGLVRTINQDAYSCDAHLGIAVLSDGMGGHAAGEIASHMVVDGLSEVLTKVGDTALEDLPARIEDSILVVNTKLIQRSQEDASCRGMGATANVLCFAHGHVTIGHVGDSRTYFIRTFTAQGDKPRFGIWQLTIDHNLGTFVDRGILALSAFSNNGTMSEKERASCPTPSLTFTPSSSVRVTYF
jgi:PPM family protein phosphatase